MITNALPVEQVDLFRLSIPFTMQFDHATAGRNACDSLIWVVRSGEFTGVGEAVYRDYVSGPLGSSAIETAAKQTLGLLTTRLRNKVSLEALKELAADESIQSGELPALCGMETALLDLLCNAHNTDVYDLLEMAPRRDQMRYGGTVPLLDPQKAKRILAMYRELGIDNLRIKVSRDEEQAAETITIARTLLGKEFDLRVDANASWRKEDAGRIIPILVEQGISIVEEPTGRDRELQIHLARTYPEITFAADESALTISDLKRMKKDDTFGMINIRLSKNGGLLRALDLAKRATAFGIRYQLGCHVGETGVLSATGRAAASLMENPEYVDGSYDRYLLSGNVTTQHVSFGPGGVAPVIRGKGLGFEADLSEIERWSVEHKQCV